MLEFKVFSPEKSSSHICYIILPEGLADDVLLWMSANCEILNCHFVAISGVDWNNDLTPWEAKGVFRQAKPFGGKAERFLRTLEDTVINNIEENLGKKGPSITRRSIAGISLSGLFAVWSALSSNLYDEAISISGSLWYDGFADWVSSCNPQKVKRVIFLLGEREKNSKDSRMATVQDCTQAVSESLSKLGIDSVFQLVEGTHFSPVVPRLDIAFRL